MINSIVLLFVSLAIDPLARKLGVKLLWGIVNFVLGVCFVMTIDITRVAEREREKRSNGDVVVVEPSVRTKSAALAVFGVLGLPLAVTYSIPFAMASIYSHRSGAGQGLSLGVVNMSICFPQMVISLWSGLFDAAFGGGNLSAFIVGTVAAFVSVICAATMLPKPKGAAGWFRGRDRCAASTEAVKLGFSRGRSEKLCFRSKKHSISAARSSRINWLVFGPIGIKATGGDCIVRDHKIGARDGGRK
ncbi:unnamed protein product [Linum trigynum]|uniref:Uncharacterized protein n=1 Tax=Linum trigynum TaxID=586398 RepID=A0AAV2DVI7_9ROSI